MVGDFVSLKQKNSLVGVLDNNFLVRVMESENAARLLFQKVAIDRTRAHHNDLAFQRRAVGRRGFELLFGGRNLVVERDKTQIAALARDQVVTEVEGQRDPDNDNQVLAEQVFLFDESLHPPNESHLSLRVKQKHDMNQSVMWKQFQNTAPK